MGKAVSDKPPLSEKEAGLHLASPCSLSHAIFPGRGQNTSNCPGLPAPEAKLQLYHTVRLWL